VAVCPYVLHHVTHRGIQVVADCPVPVLAG
jgi:hypothetical protein